MLRDEVEEFHYITPVTNVPSIVAHGILSHNRARRVDHVSIAMPEIQERRARKQIPGTGPGLHDFVNLYFDAHNPMLSRRRAENHSICVLRIESEALDIAGSVIVDRNASSNWAAFYASPQGLANLDSDMVYARYWIHGSDPFLEMEHKSKKCAELLVPDRVRASYIAGAYVANPLAEAAFKRVSNLPVEVNASMFF